MKFPKFLTDWADRLEERAKRKMKEEEDPALRLVFDMVVNAGDINLALAILRSPGFLLVRNDEIKRLVENLRGSPRESKEKAGHLFALLRSFKRIYYLSKIFTADDLAEEIIQLDPNLKPLVASRDITAISGPCRIALVREMLEAKEVDGYEILKALPEKVLPQDAWNVAFCQQLVSYAIEKEELFTAFVAASRLEERKSLPEEQWKTLLEWGIGAVSKKQMTQEQLMDLARVASA